MPYSLTYPYRWATHQQYYWHSSDNTKTYFLPNTVVSSGISWYGSRSGTSVPGYKDKIKKGISASSGFSSDRHRVLKMTPYVGSYSGSERRLPEPPYSNQTIHKIDGEWDVVPFGFNSTIGHLNLVGDDSDAKALAKILKRVREMQQNMNGLTTLGELRETAGMILRPAGAFRDGITNYMRDVRRKGERATRGVTNRRKRRDILRDVVTGTWLEASFGWAPLLSDTVGIAETFARFADEKANKVFKRQERLQASGRSLASQAFGTQIWHRTNSWADAFVNQTRMTSKTVKYVVALNLKTNVGTDSASRLADLAGFNLGNFVPTIWELVPWSFLVDYFVGVGDFLENVCTSTSDIAWTSKTTRTVTTDNYTARWVGPGAVNTFSHNITFAGVQSGQLVTRRTTLSRSVPTSLGVPPLEFKSPMGSMFKMANIFALWSQQSRGFNGLIHR